MTLLTRAASTNANVTTGWTNPTYGYADDTSYATCSPAKNSTVNSDYGFADFTSAHIPDGATIVSVTMSARTWAANAAITQGIQGMDTGATSGSEATDTQTSEATLTATLSGITLTDLRSASTVLKARVRATRGSGNTAYTASLDWVTIDVTYTVGAILKVRRSSAWTAGAVKVRRSNAWVDPTAVKVRRSGAWTTVT